MSEAGPVWQPSRPGGNSDRRQGSGEGAGAGSAGDGDGGGGGTAGGMDAMFDRLREAAAAHDDSYDPLP
jgi:hypothetical protein